MKRVRCVMFFKNLTLKFLSLNYLIYKIKQFGRTASARIRRKNGGATELLFTDYLTNPSSDISKYISNFFINCLEFL